MSNTQSDCRDKTAKLHCISDFRLMCFIIHGASRYQDTIANILSSWYQHSDYFVEDMARNEIRCICRSMKEVIDD